MLQCRKSAVEKTNSQCVGGHGENYITNKNQTIIQNEASSFHACPFHVFVKRNIYYSQSMSTKTVTNRKDVAATNPKFYVDYKRRPQ